MSSNSRGKPAIQRKMLRKNGRWTVTMIRALEDDRKWTTFREAQEEEARMTPEEWRQYVAEMQEADAEEARQREAFNRMPPLTELVQPWEGLDE